MFICLSLLFAFTLFLSVFSSKLRNAASLGIGLTFCMGFLIIGNKEYLGGETLPDLQTVSYTHLTLPTILRV